MGLSAAKNTLIVGCGNPHRRDDGVGGYVIAQLESKLKKGSKIKTLVVHQLGLELADEIKNFDQVIFVDATVKQHKKSWKLAKLASEGRELKFSHYLDPSTLLRLVEAIYQKKPIGYVFSVSGLSFDFGSTLSPKVQKAADEVVEEILRLFGAQNA